VNQPKYLEYQGLFARARLRYFRRILRQLQSMGCRRLLDYGCGPGDLLLLCREAGISAVGVDVSARSVELAAKRGLSVLLGDENRPEIAAEKFDAIVLHSVIEHLPDPVGVLQRLTSRGLAAGGILVLSAPTPGADFWNDPTHVRPHTPRSLQIFGELLGLEVVAINYVFAYLLGLKLRSSFWYRFLNVVPAPLGSNLVAFYRKPGVRTDGV